MECVSVLLCVSMIEFHLSVVGGGRLACSNFQNGDLVWNDTKLENKFGRGCEVRGMVSSIIY